MIPTGSRHGSPVRCGSAHWQQSCSHGRAQLACKWCSANVTRMNEKREGHGWWPYLGPYLGFGLVSAVADRLPEAAAPAMLVVKPGVTAALLIYFWWRGAYPELRGFRWGSPWVLADAGVGVALAVLWIAPYLVFPSIRPDDVSGGLDPEMLGSSLVPAVLVLRMVGYAGVTPIFEELFMRSFVIRFAEVWNGRGDFRDIPIAHYARNSFIAVVVIFTLAHMPWEYWVMVPWAILSTLWFYWRRHLMAVIVLHAATNGAILLIAALTDGMFRDDAGNPLPLWFFV